MDRRFFLKVLAGGVVAAPAVSYFDMGASWKKHEDLWIFDGIDRGIHPVRTLDIEPIFRKYYNKDVVDSLTFRMDGYCNLVMGR